MILIEVSFPTNSTKENEKLFESSSSSSQQQRNVSKTVLIKFYKVVTAKLH